MTPFRIQITLESDRTEVVPSFPLSKSRIVFSPALWAGRVFSVVPDRVASLTMVRLEVAARPGMVLRPLVKGDEVELLRIHATPEVMRWWGLPDEDFPWADDSESNRLTIEVEGAIVGLIQFSELLEPKYRHASIDLFLDPALHGRGIGTEAVRRVVRHLIDDRGHHRITIDPAAANTAAIRTYEKVDASAF